MFTSLNPAKLTLHLSGGCVKMKLFTNTQLVEFQVLFLSGLTI